MPIVMNNDQAQISKSKTLWLLLLLVVTWLVYRPALSGGFLLDDYPNLSKLQLINGELTIENLKNYLYASESGVLKRPVSVLSFLLDSHKWPVEAYNFKKNNLILHLLNGALLVLLLWQILQSTIKDTDQRFVVVLVASALWLLNPFMMSTVMYPVQRMSMLPVTCLLLGLHAYITIRLKHDVLSTKRQHGYLLLLLLGVAGVAALAKENGLLLLLLFPLFEQMVCKRCMGLPALNKSGRLWLVVIPVALFVLAFLLQLPQLSTGYEYREFSVFERLLSQPHAITSYLMHLLLPATMTEGVYTDGFSQVLQHSHHWKLYVSWLILMALVVLAWLSRNKYPWLGFALAFYLVGHLLESTIIPLELYFEHRNYLPALFLFVPVALLLRRLLRQKHWLIAVSVLLVGVFAFQTYLKASIWGDDLLLHERTISEYPESSRVKLAGMQKYFAAQQGEQALAVLTAGLQQNNDLSLRIVDGILKCNQGIFTEADYAQLTAALQQHQFTKEMVASFDQLYQALLDGQCQYVIDDQQVDQLLQLFADNVAGKPRFGRSLLYYFQAYFALARAGDVSASSQLFIKSFEQNQDFVTLITGIRAFNQRGDHQAVLALAEYGLSVYPEIFTGLKIDWRGYQAIMTQFKNNAEARLAGSTE